MIKETVTVTEDATGGTWSNNFSPPANPKLPKQGKFTISISGTFSATVSLQRSFDGGSTWMAVASYTAATEAQLTDHTLGILYRLGVANGDWSSGTVNGIIAK